MNIFKSMLLLSCFLAACNSSGVDNDVKYKLDNLHQEVMDVHDAVMPELGTINKLRKQLKKQLKDDSNPNKDKVQDLIYRLGEADDAMMTWMSEFKKPSYKDEAAARTIYEQEKIKITAVDQKMKKAIVDAQNYLAQ